MPTGRLMSISSILKTANLSINEVLIFIILSFGNSHNAIPWDPLNFKLHGVEFPLALSNYSSMVNLVFRQCINIFISKNSYL